MKHYPIAALAGALALAFAAQILPAQTPAAQRPWMDARLGPDRRADMLLAQMTMDEKIALLHGPMAVPYRSPRMPEGAIGSAGFIAGNQRLGIPALQESDASLGVTNPQMVRGPGDMSSTSHAAVDPRAARRPPGRTLGVYG